MHACGPVASSPVSSAAQWNRRRLRRQHQVRESDPRPLGGRSCHSPGHSLAPNSTSHQAACGSAHCRVPRGRTEYAGWVLFHCRTARLRQQYFHPASIGQRCALPLPLSLSSAYACHLCLPPPRTSCDAPGTHTHTHTLARYSFVCPGKLQHDPHNRLPTTARRGRTLRPRLHARHAPPRPCSAYSHSHQGPVSAAAASRVIALPWQESNQTLPALCAGAAAASMPCSR